MTGVAQGDALSEFTQLRFQVPHFARESIAVRHQVLLHFGDKFIKPLTFFVSKLITFVLKRVEPLITFLTDHVLIRFHLTHK